MGNNDKSLSDDRIGHLHSDGPSNNTTQLPFPIQRLLEMFAPKLVLEVLGAAGAIWGSSDALGLRNASNDWFWRPCAIVVGLAFLTRWVRQVRVYILDTTKSSSCREEGWFPTKRTNGFTAAMATASMSPTGAEMTGLIDGGDGRGSSQQ